jgi:DNA-directed RNA polymerase specialized sigma24 family protein
VSKLARTLKPEYAEALHRIDVDGTPVKDHADEAGISASNAGARVFRACEALRKQVARSCGTCAEHGCLDCTCGSK